MRALITARKEHQRLRIWHWLEEHSLGEQIFEQINATLADQGVWLKRGTVVDSTFIQAQAQRRIKRRNAMKRWTKVKRAIRYIGMMVQVGVDAMSGGVLSVAATVVNGSNVLCMRDNCCTNKRQECLAIRAIRALRNKVKTG